MLNIRRILVCIRSPAMIAVSDRQFPIPFGLQIEEEASQTEGILTTGYGDEQTSLGREKTARSEDSVQLSMERCPGFRACPRLCPIRP